MPQAQLLDMSDDDTTKAVLIASIVRRTRTISSPRRMRSARTDSAVRRAPRRAAAGRPRVEAVAPSSKQFRHEFIGIVHVLDGEGGSRTILESVVRRDGRGQVPAWPLAEGVQTPAERDQDKDRHAPPDPPGFAPIRVKVPFRLTLSPGTLEVRQTPSSSYISPGTLEV